MTRNLIVAVLALTCIGAYSLVQNKKNSEKLSDKDNFELNLSWKETDNSLSLLNSGEIVWRLNYDRSEDKPYFYPLRTPGGIDLALKRPEDHPWHRGLWFSWKYINGVNYWEEDPEAGVAPGRSLVHKVDVQKNSDYSATVEMVVHYTPDANQDPLLVEHRTLSISAPTQNGNYHIDWYHAFSAQDRPVTLDRTPPQKHGGPSWGGYAGISFRASLEELASFRYLDSKGWVRNESLTGYGKHAKWMDLSGQVISQSSQVQAAGLAIFDHPDNPRHPSPWYIWYDNEGEGDAYKHAFFTPAFLWNNPYELPAGGVFSLQYRTLIHEGTGSLKQFNSEYEAFIEDN